MIFLYLHVKYTGNGVKGDIVTDYEILSVILLQKIAFSTRSKYIGLPLTRFQFSCTFERRCALCHTKPRTLKTLFFLTGYVVLTSFTG